MMTINADAILNKVLPNDLINRVGLYEREFTSKMSDNNYFKELIKEKYDTYRDLKKIHADKYCKDNNFNLTNTLVVDSDPRKLQFCLANSITSEEYCK